MDRTLYCDEVTARLQKTRAAHERRAFPAPAGRETARLMAQKQQENANFIVRVDATLARVARLRESAPADWDAEERELERELAEIDAIAMTL
jgi:hypothetical protein